MINKLIKFCQIEEVGEQSNGGQNKKQKGVYGRSLSQCMIAAIKWFHF